MSLEDAIRSSANADLGFLRVSLNDDGSIKSSALGGSRAFAQDSDPSSGLTVGTEYVWFQMDGTGDLVDIKFGVA